MLFLVDSLPAPPRAANSRRLNCLPDGVTCRYAAYTGDEFAISVCVMKNLSSDIYHFRQNGRNDKDWPEFSFVTCLLDLLIISKNLI